jgi:hypothetical protein
MNIDDLKGQTNGKYVQGGGNGSEVQIFYNHITHIEVVDKRLKKKYTHQTHEKQQNKKKKTQHARNFSVFSPSFHASNVVVDHKWV